MDPFEAIAELLLHRSQGSRDRARFEGDASTHCVVIARIRVVLVQGRARHRFLVVDRADAHLYPDCETPTQSAGRQLPQWERGCQSTAANFRL